jgi:hypothetical protein
MTTTAEDHVTPALERAEADPDGGGQVYATLALTEAVHGLTRAVEEGFRELTAALDRSES